MQRNSFRHRRKKLILKYIYINKQTTKNVTAGNIIAFKEHFTADQNIFQLAYQIYWYNTLNIILCLS